MCKCSKMIRYDRNFHFCYIPNNSKVYTLNKHIRTNIPSHSKSQTSLNYLVATTQFYTVPYISRVDNSPINVLFGFVSKDDCIEHLSTLNFHKEKTEQIDEPSVVEYDLNDMKALSDILKLPLIIEVAKKSEHYELFFYKAATPT